MLRIWAWSPSSTVAMVRRSFGGMLSPAWRRRSGRIGHGRFNGASAYFPDTPALPAARHGKAQAWQGIRVVQDGGTQFVDAHREQAVVAGQAGVLLGAPQGPVVLACAAGVGVGDVDEAEGSRVLQEDAQR